MPSVKCMIDGCSGSAGAELRGLCMRCYSKAKGMVTRGEVTWQDLIDLRLAKDTDPFTSAYEKALEESDADSQ